jgi:hypothetical protein
MAIHQSVLSHSPCVHRPRSTDLGQGRRIACLVFTAAALSSAVSSADAVTDWNVIAGDVVTAERMGTPPANRVMAIVQTATYHAVNAITRRYPGTTPGLDAAAGASIEAAVAAVNRAVLSELVPAQRSAIDAAYQRAIAKLPDGTPRTTGIAVGERAAAAVLAARADDGVTAREAYRPQVTAGVYVPTAMPAASQWPQRRPWLMTSPEQFQPGPPPALGGAAWAQDYNEIKAIGEKTSSVRSAEQTAIARFWEATLPPIYHGIVRSVASGPGREVTRNARLFAAVTQAVDDAMIAVFAAKYHYAFWRPVTAIRNGDLDGNDATERAASWVPLIDTPMHPEYPCAHCIVAATIGTVLRAEIGAGATPTLTASSPTAGGAVRTWSTIEAFVAEVANARVYGGVHYRSSTKAAAAMGEQIGALAAAKHLQPPRAGAKARSSAH